MAFTPGPSRRDQALDLSEELLADIELGKLQPIEIARKTYRLARLLDDIDAVQWLAFEVNGYKLLQPNNVFEVGGWEAACRSNRDSFGPDGKHTASPLSLGELASHVEAGRIQLAAAGDRPVSIQSANPAQMVHAPPTNASERLQIRRMIGTHQGLIDKVLGAMHSYVVERHDEMRFGSATETAFGVIRVDVDARIAELVPEAPMMLAAAFENITSDNPEHWSNAASVCRRLLKAAADALRPAGEPVAGRQMTDSHYINRLIDWIAAHGVSDTATALTVSELEHLGKRIDASDGAGQKGAHESVDRRAAARFLVGTYLLLGDILELATTVVVADAAGHGEPTAMTVTQPHAGSAGA
jgi:AbiTii